jgi:hypothetical protein
MVLPLWRFIVLSACLLLVESGVSSPSYAKLGGEAITIDLDQQALAATRRVSVARRKYTVHEMETANGVVREYISAAGTVFAVTWKGRVHPDFSLLLGDYFSDYQHGAKHQPRARGRRHQQIQSDRMVVEKGGRMRKVRGRAFLPTQIPTGVKLNELL